MGDLHGRNETCPSMSPEIIEAMQNTRFFHEETSSAMFNAELYWFFGGIFTAWAFCAFGMIIRGVRAGAGHVDI